MTSLVVRVECVRALDSVAEDLLAASVDDLNLLGLFIFVNVMFFLGASRTEPVAEPHKTAGIPKSPRELLLRWLAAEQSRTRLSNLCTSGRNFCAGCALASKGISTRETATVVHFLK